MQYIVDLILLLVFALVIFLAAKRGFFRTLMELAASIISLIGAKLLSAAFAPVIYTSLIDAPIRSALVRNLGGVGEKDYAAQASAALNSIPVQFDGVLKMIGVDRSALEQTIKNSKFAGKDLVSNLMDNVVSPIASAIIQTLLFVIMVVVFGIILRLIIRLIVKIIKDVPTLKQIDSSLGAVLGVIKGIVLVAVLALLIGSLSGLIGNEKFTDTVNSSLILQGTHSLLNSISGYTA